MPKRPPSPPAAVHADGYIRPFQGQTRHETSQVGDPIRFSDLLGSARRLSRGDVPEISNRSFTPE